MSSEKEEIEKLEQIFEYAYAFWDTEGKEKPFVQIYSPVSCLVLHFLDTGEVQTVYRKN